MQQQQCTPKEIEEKRRRAQEKLAAKRFQQSPLKSQPPTTSSPRFKFHNTKPYQRNGNVQAQVTAKPVVQFYDKTKQSTTVKLLLIKEDRFACSLSDYNQVAIDVFKTIPSRIYDPTSRMWNFHINDYNVLLANLKPLGMNIEQLPQYVLNCLRENCIRKEYDFSRLDPELNNALMPFQRDGVSFGIDKNGRCLIADDMGLGKTFQALAIANYYQEDWPLLIVTTASMKNVWVETIQKFLPSVPLMDTFYMTSAKDFIGNIRVLIVSHDLMSRCIDRLVERKFGVIIIDESHVLKNFKAKVTQSATKLSKIARRIILLSGTPALSRPSELYSQLSLLEGNCFGGFMQYSKRYCDGKETNFGWDASGKSNLQELEIVLSRKFMIRRSKEEVLKSLPNKKQEVVTLDVNLNQFSEEDRKCLQALAAKYLTVKKSTEKHSLLLSFFAETAKIKIPSVCSYILQMLETKRKFLIFAHHQIMLNAVENILKRKSISFIRIDGNTSSDQRKYFVDKFQLKPECQCAILSITAANAGITLTAAQLVIFAELHWNPSILSQAESRAHRIGQENTVLVQYLLAPGTADDSIWPLLQEKQKILSEVGLSKDSYETVSVTKQDKSETITDGLNTTITDTFNVTSANTLDITSYFKSAHSDSISNTSSFGGDEESDDIFNDGLDEAFCNINF